MFVKKKFCRAKRKTFWCYHQHDFAKTSFRTNFLPTRFNFLIKKIQKIITRNWRPERELPPAITNSIPTLSIDPDSQQHKYLAQKRFCFPCFHQRSGYSWLFELSMRGISRFSTMWRWTPFEFSTIQKTTLFASHETLPRTHPSSCRRTVIVSEVC